MKGFFETVGGWSWIAGFGGWEWVDWSLLFGIDRGISLNIGLGIGLGIGLAELIHRKCFDRVGKSGNKLHTCRRQGISHS